MTDHHRVHDAHGHPAKLGQHQRHGKVDGWAQLLPNVGPKGHDFDLNRIQRVYVETIRCSKWQRGTAVHPILAPRPSAGGEGQSEVPQERRSGQGAGMVFLELLILMNFC
jgi:hypothetical protein